MTAASDACLPIQTGNTKERLLKRCEEQQLRCVLKNAKRDGSIANIEEASGVRLTQLSIAFIEKTQCSRHAAARQDAMQRNRHAGGRLNTSLW
uniref:Transposase n=1 Tax=Ascaris lumbricoides TaxID=6252 RepID=A0A0M3HWM2_ASCLU